MRALRFTPFALGLALACAISPLGAQTTEGDPTRSGVEMPEWASDDPIANEGVIEDGAIDALKEMSAYLMSATTLGITSQGSMDAVTSDGQRIQLV